MIYRAAIFASIAEVIPCLMMCVMSRMDPLLWGAVELLDRKKSSPDLLCTVGLLRWLESLWASNFMLLVLCVRTASSCVAT